MSATDLLRPVAGDMLAVDSVIRRRLASDVVLIRTIADYIIGAGGKRLRPAVLLLMGRALGSDSSAHQELAATIEFIHTATLLHDDVVDESDLRRGRPTSNAAFGNPASVLVGDFLYSRAFQMMVDVGSMRVMSILADATNRISEGEVLQLMNVHDPSVTEQRYLQVIERKTAALFEAAARIGAVLAGADEDTEVRCARYGASLGKAFQIIDDVLDYSGHVDDLGKQLGDDLREGKATLPLIHALAGTTGNDRAMIESAIRDGGGDFVAIGKLVQANGSLQYARRRAEHEAQVAYDAVASLPATAFRRSLLDLTSFAIDRDH
ncbi:MAG: polyprenyl synthetase family protein [Burkholderiaceae bacterium]|nr:polyprenyl synthetase family protein [Burkholderiaceae bacterium]